MAEDFICQTYSLQFAGEDRTGAIKMGWDFITIKIKNFCFDFPLRTIVHLRSNIYFPSRCSIRYPSEIPVIFQPSPRYGVWTRGWKLRFMFD